MSGNIFGKKINSVEDTLSLDVSGTSRCAASVDAREFRTWIQDCLKYLAMNSQLENEVKIGARYNRY